MTAEKKSQEAKEEIEKESKGAWGNVIALGLVSLFTDISSEMSFSILPAFILDLPGGNMAVLGFIDGVAESLSYALRAISGIFSDMFRKRKLITLIGYAFSTGVKPLFAVAQTTFDVLIIRVSDRIGKAVRTAPRDALLAESVPEERRGAAFGLHRSMDKSGAILGPFFASAFMILLGFSVRIVFWLSLIPGAISLFILIFFVHERYRKGVGQYKLLSGMRKALTGDFTVLLIVVGVFSLGAFNYSFTLAYARNSGVPDPYIPLVYAVVNIAHVLIAIPAGILSDRIGKEKVLVMGYGILLATDLLLILLPSLNYVAVLIALVYGIYWGIIETIPRALVPKYAGTALSGTAYALYYIVVGLALFVANAVVGLLWQQYGVSIAAIYSATLSVVGIAGMLLFINHSHST